eukprot:CAMPEP_0172678930 /NCGR_PEP_ID=MMETSP1074-20121228/15721_1 /TAXON_ID=2916 /ORGANISM="Ceratium fusus, Strain PA161109" /LENGTH=98 /DNA_ID=CAMNT_0013497033 /DNA_START=12 /DNA_END=308 /DNA_ORIENTATION=+
MQPSGCAGNSDVGVHLTTANSANAEAEDIAIVLSIFAGFHLEQTSQEKSRRVMYSPAPAPNTHHAGFGKSNVLDVSVPRLIPGVPFPPDHKGVYSAVR